MKLFFSELSLLVHWSTLFVRILKDRKKRWSRKTASFTQFTLLDDEITEIIFFSEFSLLDHLSTFFVKTFKGTDFNENMK